jgi:hypothetical protein
MTTLSAEEELILRVWVGDDVSNSYLESLYDAMAPDSSWDAVVVGTLRHQIALAAGQPQSFSVPGLSLSWGQQVDALNQMLDDFLMTSGTGLDGEDGTMGGVGIGHLLRRIPR